MTTRQLTRLNNLLVDRGIYPANLTDQTHFSRDLGLDSLDVADLIIHVEDSFGIRIPDEDWNDLETIGQLRAYLTQELQFETGRKTPFFSKLSEGDV